MLGITGPRLLFGHLLPACVPALRTRLALDLAGIVLAAAALGFLGLGVRPPTPEWGTMVAEGSRVVFDQWWLAAIPGAAIFLVSFALNCVADGLPDPGGPRAQ
jgi:peptide/nickel transport system permease protein